MEAEHYRQLNDAFDRIRRGCSTSAEAEVIRMVINELRRERNLLRHRVDRFEDTVRRDNELIGQAAARMKTLLIPDYVFGDGHSR